LSITFHVPIKFLTGSGQNRRQPAPAQNRNNSAPPNRQAVGRNSAAVRGGNRGGHVSGLRQAAGGGVIKNRPTNQQGRRGGRDEGRLTRTILSDAAILDGKTITIADKLTKSVSNIQWTHLTDPINI
jgi:hypothetical protein